jgi:23S rRNA pseudouridine1911/1915/1917 synthase
MELSESLLLIESLAQLFPECSQNKLRRMLKSGRVHVDGEEVHAAKLELHQGQVVEVNQHGNPESAKIKLDAAESRRRSGGRKLTVIYEDEDILIVEKPSGLLTVATNKLEPDTLHSRAQSHVRRNDADAWAHIVHRLDKRTSGILVFAKSEDVKLMLQHQFADRSVERIYHAVVEGRLVGEGTVHNYLYEDRNLRVFASMPHKHGSREAITHWRSIAICTTGNYTLVRLEIGTGRRHQIRVHMADLGHPVSGDFDHNSKTDPFNRLLLNASVLGFDHPDNGERCRFKCPIPQMFRTITSESDESVED